MASTYFVRSFNKYSREAADSNGGLVENPSDPNHNDEYDAYRHALMSAKLTEATNADAAKWIMDDYEERHPNDPDETNMDRWNNNVGREQYQQWKAASDAGLTTDSLEKWIYDAVERGDTINNPSDSRQWQEPEDAFNPEQWVHDNVANPLAQYVLDDGVSKLRELYRAAESILSPIILDLDGDGVETLNVYNGTYFDHDGNGFAERTGWVGADDGLLVWDRNSDGVISDGTELFGSETLLVDGSKASNGFAALAELDTNGDGKIDSNDTAWGYLAVWRDINSDGISSPDEISGVGSIGIASIQTDFDNYGIEDAQGNMHGLVGGYTRTDGTAGVATDVWFDADLMFTVAKEQIVVPLDIESLPDLQGYGNIYDLHQAMARDSSGSLRALVEQFGALDTVDARNSCLEQIIFKWAGTEAIDPASRGGYIDARRLVALERFFGQDFVGTLGANPGSAPADALNQVYDGLFEIMYSELMTQTHFSSIYDLITYSWGNGSPLLQGDLGAVIAEIDGALNADAMVGRVLLGEFARTQQGLSAQDITTYEAFRSHYVSQDEEFSRIIDSGGKVLVTGSNTQDSLTITNADKIIYVGDGDDSVDVNSGSSIVHGGAGNDTVTVASNSRNTLYGDEGDDVLQSNRAYASYAYNYGNTFAGGAGNDRLVGWYGADTYIFNRGDGQDVINENSGGYSTTDVVQFGPGITVDDITVRKDGNNVVVIIADPNDPTANDQITIEAWSGTYQRIESFVFADGGSLSADDITTLAFTGTEGADTLVGWNNTALTISGMGGDDILQGANLNDTIYGGDGNDTITDGGGTNTIYGGAGNDTVTVGYQSRNTIYGEDGDDVLQSNRAGPSSSGANYGNTFVGGAGNDRLVGWSGADTYIFNRGDGQDVINDETIYSNGYSDTLIFGAGITAGDLSASVAGNNLVISIDDPGNPNTTDRITIEGWSSAYKRIESFVFADGSSLSADDITTLAFTGTEGADTLVGWNNTALTINGMGGDDILQGANLNDTIYGGDGNDFLEGGYGNDTLNGGTGADEMVGGYGDDVYYIDDVGDIATELSGQGADTVNSAISYTLGANVEHLTLTGSDAIDGAGNTLSNILTGNDAANVLSGDAGNDILRGMAGDDALYGGDGNDTIETGYGFDYAYGGAGNDTIVGGDNVAGGWAAEYLYGEDGDDILQGGGKYAHLYGGAGNDELRAGSGYQQLYGEDGDDTLIAGTNTYLLNGGAGADQMVGGSNNNTYVVDNVGDVIVEAADAGTDTVNSSISYTLGDNLENLTLTGTEAISGTGNAVNNTLNGSQNSAANTLAGGLGDDTYVIGAGDVIIEQAGEGIDSVTVETSYTLGDNLENLTLTGSAAVNGTGNALDNRLVGNNANNVLAGGAGNDYLSGMYGNDTLNGGAGADEMLGGYGNDVYYVDQAGDIVTELSGQGTDTVSSSVSYTLTENVERLTLTGTTAGVATGNTLANILTGNSIANALIGDAGNDTLRGMGGNDWLLGGTGNDTLEGGDGNDTLSGGAGADTLTGGWGSDQYTFVRGDGQDLIRDYDARDADPATYGETTDAVQFGGDIAHDQLWFSRNGDNLYVDVIGTSDRIVMENWYLADTYQVDELWAGDGYTLLNEQVEQLVQAMAAFAPPASGELNLPESYRADLDPVLAANWQAA